MDGMRGEVRWESRILFVAERHKQRRTALWLTPRSRLVLSYFGNRSITVKTNPCTLPLWNAMSDWTGDPYYCPLLEQWPDGRR